MAVTNHRKANPTCRKCGDRLTEANWSRCHRVGSRRQFICSLCATKSSAEWKKANRAALRAKDRADYRNKSRRFDIYGMTPADYATLLAKQDGRCAVCQDREPTDIDHCHSTGKVRGLLCRACNLALGMLKDDTRLFRRAIAYLIDPPA